MTFQFRVYYRDDSIRSFDKIRFKNIRARNRDQAAERFRAKYGCEPLYVK